MPLSSIVKTLKPTAADFMSSWGSLVDQLQEGRPTHVVVDSGATPLQWQSLSNGLVHVPWGALSQLSLHVTQAMLASPEFIHFLNRLNQHGPHTITLLFDDVTADIETSLITHVAGIATYPVIVVHAATGERQHLPRFEKAIIKTIQSAPKLSRVDAPVTAMDEEIGDDAGQLIRLKALIHRDREKEATDYRAFVAVDIVEHVEQQDEQVEEVVDVAVEEERVVAQYQGELVDYAAFNAPRYHRIAEASLFKPEQVAQAFLLAKTELFANLPQGVKYLSPAAADRLASHLPQWVVFNKDRMPYLTLKQTARGEWLLDYDPLDELDVEKHPLAVHDFSPYDDRRPYYQIDFKDAMIQPLINNPTIAADLKKQAYVPLMNLWVRHGDEGVKRFFTRLQAMDTVHPNASLYLYEKYLSHFEHWDAFYTDDFFDSLLKLNDYSPLQWSCLQRVLNETGASQHDLSQTLMAFDFFWQQCRLLCGDDETLLQRLNTNWSTLIGGQPVVYMDRLLKILQKARNVPEQLLSLDGLVLDNYGAYYAACYEGFIAVHPTMRLIYDSEKLNAMSFNRDFQLYRIELDTLCELMKREGRLVDNLRDKEDLWLIASNDVDIKAPFESLVHKMSYADYMTACDELPPSYHLYVYKGPAECELMQISSVPDEKKLDSLPIRSNAAYLRVGDELYYVNKWRKECNLLKFEEPFTIQAFDERFHPSVQALVLNQADLDDVTPMLAYSWKRHHYDGSISRNRSLLPMSAKQCYTLMYRFMGQQNSGMSLYAFLQAFQALKDNIRKKYSDSGVLSVSYRDAHFELPLRVLHLLFFITHEQYLGRLPEGEASFFDSFVLECQRANTGHLINEVDRFRELFAHNVKLGEKEALQYVEVQQGSDRTGVAKDRLIDFLNHVVLSVHKSYSNQFSYESSWERNISQEYPQRFFEKLLTNKYSAFKFMRFVSSLENTWERKVTLYAFNTEDYFAEVPAIASTFRDELLMFSVLLNHYEMNLVRSDFDNYMKSNYEYATKLKEIRRYLERATEGELSCNYLHCAVMLIAASETLLGEEKCGLVIRPNKLTDEELRRFSKSQYILTTTEFYYYNKKTDTLSFITKEKSVLDDLAKTFPKQKKDDVTLIDELLSWQLGSITVYTGHSQKTYLQVYDKVLTLFKDMSALPLKEGQLDMDAVRLVFAKHGIPIKTHLSSLLTRDMSEVRDCIRFLILELEFSTTDMEMQQRAARQTELRGYSLTQLQALLKQRLSAADTVTSVRLSFSIKKRLSELRVTLIDQAVTSDKTVAELPLMKAWAEGILRLRNLQDSRTFEKVEQVVKEGEALAALCQRMAKQECVIRHQDEFLRLFATVRWSNLDSDVVFAWFDWLSTMSSRDHLPLLQALLTDNAILYDKDSFFKLLQWMRKLHGEQVSTEAMVHFCRRFCQSPSSDYQEFVAEWMAVLATDQDDPLIRVLLTHPKLTSQQMLVISEQTKDITVHRGQVADVYVALQEKGQLNAFSKTIKEADAPTKALLVSLLAMAFAARRARDPDINLLDMTKKLQGLSFEQLQALHKHYATTKVSISCLNHALATLSKETPFADFLSFLEKSPFGPRDLKEQFSCQEVERVVNGLTDLLNHSPYPYLYRKKLMETFVLVNDMGQTLPVYYGKPAKELTNAEIKAFFQALKQNTIYTPLQKRLLALGLMREAMYRSTGQFPYSTQMLGLIDCMWHEGDVITNVDTGQGKSLKDVMKAAFLWLESDRVDVSTSSLVDAARDIENYSPFLTLLGIPFAAKPITASAPVANFCLNGINFSTVAQLSLFFSKVLVAGDSVATPNDSVSLVLNESDYALLDDRAVKRFAAAERTPIGKKYPWIYDVVNDYVDSAGFKMGHTSKATDLRRLRRELVSRARMLNKSSAPFSEVDDEQLLDWINSALLVAHDCRESFEYVVVPVPGDAERYQAQLLMSDGKPSSDAVFGKGMQQLLHARLNQQKRIKTVSGKDAFEIKPENRTIISSDNRSLVNYYRAKRGFIWGSSGTVGSDREIEEQYQKYGFEFSRLDPHQKKRVREQSLVVLPNQKAQYNRLVKTIKAKKSSSPTLIFCENIEKAKALHAHLAAHTDASHLQLFTGVEDAPEVVLRAKTPGMFTITTAAIGRNTDILYDKTVGLDVWHTGIASTRLDRQKSGRTGRQGSPGKISYFLNREDQGIDGPDAIVKLRERLDDAGRHEREYHETFYSMLGHFLAHVERMPSDAFTTMSKSVFLRDKWSLFSEQQEHAYQELRLKRTFSESVFVAAMKEAFVALIQEVVPHYDLRHITDVPLASFLLKKAYCPYQKKVTLADGVSSRVMAAELFYASLPKTDTVVWEDDLKRRAHQGLQRLFSRAHQPHAVAEFFHWLGASFLTQQALRAVYKEFLTDFLKASQQQSKVQRWFKRNRLLSTLVHDESYLCLFHALAVIDSSQAIVNVDVIKDAVSALIEDYLANSWFISSSKRDAALALKNTILQSADVAAVMASLVDSQLDVAKRDVTLNQHRLKAVNFFGRSRLQETISNALALTTSLGGLSTKTNELVEGLDKTLQGLVPDESKSSEVIASVDKVGAVMSSPKMKDKPNARVLAVSLKKALLLNSEKDTGMTGRHRDTPPKTGKRPR